jgi:HPt (histidine-containing phosphotransfer) domain-containing protein
MTANVLSEDVRQYLDAGMDAYVSKPFQINDLLLKMDGLLVGHKKKDRKVPAQVKTQPIAVPAEAQPKKETPQTAVQQPAVEQQQKEQSTNYQEVTDPPPTYRKPGQIQDTRRSNPNAPKPVQPPAAPQNTSVPAAPVPQPVVPARAELPEFVTDRNFLKQFTGGNPEKMQKYITMFMENATRLLATIDQALVNKDYATIKIAAHSLKPQLSYMGVKEEVSHIFLIEQSAGSSAHFDALPDRIKILKKVCEKAFEELRAYS